MRDERVARSQLDHPPAADPAPHATRDLPGLEQLLARQALGVADRTRDAIEERPAGKPAEVVAGQDRAALAIEAHA